MQRYAALRVGIGRQEAHLTLYPGKQAIQLSELQLKPLLILGDVFLLSCDLVCQTIDLVRQRVLL